MSLHIRRPPQLTSIVPTQKQVLLSVTALIIAVSSLLSLPASQAHADVPIYNQESPGFGDRKYLSNGHNVFAIDSLGDVFVSINNGNNNFIRKFAPDSTFIKDFTLPDLTAASSADYQHLAVDSSNNLYVINAYDKTIVVFNNDGVYQQTIAGVPSGNSDFIFDHLDNYYIVDPTNQRIQKFSHAGAFLYNVGGPTAGSADGMFNKPGDIAIDSQNNLIVTDVNNNRIQMFNSTGTFIRKFGQKNVALYCPTQPSLDNMAGLTVDQSDNIYVATHAMWCSNNIQKFSNTGTYITTQSRPQSTNYMRTSPSNVIYENENETYISGVLGGSIIARYDTNGTTLTSRFVGGPDKLARPVATVQDSAGNTYVADSMNYRIQKYDVNHNPVQTIGSYGTGNGQFHSISGLAIDKNDVLYAGDYAFSTIQKFTTSGTYLGQFGTNGTSDGQFQYLDKISVRTDGTIAALDNRFNGSSRLQFFRSDGTFVSKIALPNVASYALKSDGSVTLYADTYFYQYNATNAQIGSPLYASYYDSATNSTFRPYSDIAYDTLDNLYTLGNDSRKPQSVTTLARLNITNPDLPPYEIIAPSFNDYYNIRVSFTAANQLLVTSSVSSYVYQYNVTATLVSPNTPTNLSHTVSPHSLNVTWQVPAGPVPLKYLVEYRPHTQMQWLRSEATTTTSSTIGNLLNDDYDVRVTAMNQAGMSSPAETDSIHVAADYRFNKRIDSPNDGHIQGVSFASDGRRYDSDAYNCVINVYDVSGNFIKSFGSGGSGPGELSNPRQTAIVNNKIYVPDYRNDRVNVYDLDGNYLSTFGTSGSGDGQMQSPSQVFADTDGSVFVVSEYGNVQKYSADGTFLERSFTNVSQPVSMTRDAGGNYYIATYPDSGMSVIHKYNSIGAELLQFGTYGSGVGEMYEAPALVVNSLNQVVVNDAYNERISFYGTDGSFLYTIGRGYGSAGDYLTFDDPYAMTQASNGDLYIANSYSPYTQVLSLTNPLQGGGTPTTTVPSPPGSLTVTSPSTNTLYAAWQAPASDGGSPVTNYLFEYKPTNNTTWSQLTLTPTATTHNLTDVPAGSYDVRVSAINAIGTSLSSTPAIVIVNGATQPATPTSPAAEPVRTMPSTPYVAPPTITQPHRPGQTVTATSPAVNPPSSTSTTQPDPSSIQSSQNTAKPGTVTVTWQPPVGDTPTGYIIEYRDATIPVTDTTAPWQRATSVGTDSHSATFTLPTGSFTVRVAAVFPGEKPHIILGVAHITIPAISLPAVTPTASASSSWPVWVMICAGLVAAALLGLIPFLVWKRKRRRQQQAQATLPPRWQ